MKLNDVRIGNGIMWSNVPIQIKTPEIMSRTYQKIKEDRVQPIPLTPALLVENCGFVKAHNDIYRLSNGFYVWHNTKGDDVFEEGFYTDDDYTKVDYLHELQNYYHAKVKHDFVINLEQ